MLAYANGPINDTIHVVIGDTLLLGSNTVNTFRVAYNSADIRREYVPYFDHGTLGIRNVAIPLPGFGPTACRVVFDGAVGCQAQHVRDNSIPGGR